MQQQKTIDKIIKLIEEKQNNQEYGTITIYFQAGFIYDVSENRTRKIKPDKEKNRK